MNLRNKNKNMNKCIFSVCVFLFIVLISVELNAHIDSNDHNSLPPSQIYHAHPIGGNDAACGLYDANAIAPRMSQVIVECIDMFLNMVAIEFFGAFYGSVGNLISIICTLAVIFFGFKIMFGLESVSSQSALFMIKMVLVTVLTQDNGIMLEWRNDITQGTKDIANFMSLNAGGIFSSSTVVAIVGGQNSCALEPTIFARLDCTAVKLLGMDVSATTGVTPNNSALAALVMGLFFVGGAGLAIIMVAISFVLSLIMVMARIIIIYITAMFAITLLMGLAPIFLPMILFDSTKKMAQKWFLQIINYAIQPILLFTFLIISLGVLNYSANSLHALFIQASTEMASEGKKKVLFTLPEIDASPGTTAHDAVIKTVVKEDQGLLDGFVKYVAGKAKAIGAKIYNFVISGAQLSVNIWAADFDEILNLFANLMACLLMLMLMATFLSAIPDMVSRMTAPSGEIMTSTGAANLKAAIANRGAYVHGKASQALSAAKSFTGRK